MHVVAPFLSYPSCRPAPSFFLTWYLVRGTNERNERCASALNTPYLCSMQISMFSGGFLDVSILFFVYQHFDICDVSALIILRVREVGWNNIISIIPAATTLHVLVRPKMPLQLESDFFVAILRIVSDCIIRLTTYGSDWDSSKAVRWTTIAFINVKCFPVGAKVSAAACLHACLWCVSAGSALFWCSGAVYGYNTKMHDVRYEVCH